MFSLSCKSSGHFQSVQIRMFVKKGFDFECEWNERYLEFISMIVKICIVWAIP